MTSTSPNRRKASGIDPGSGKIFYPTELEKTLRRALTEARVRIGLTQAQVAERMGTTQPGVARLEKGEGTVGQLLEDEEIYDDLKELIRDIKRHPWKLIWQD